MDGHHLLRDFGYSTYTILPLYFDQWLRMHPKYSSDRTTHVHFGTSTFGTSGLRSFVGGETPEVNLPSDVTYRRHLLTWHGPSGYHVSLRFMIYMYLICRFHLDTCHYLTVPHVLADVVCHGLSHVLLTWSADVDLPM
jgi:hypothetical protein